MKVIPENAVQIKFDIYVFNTNKSLLLKVAVNTITPYFVLQLANRLKKFDPEKQQVGEDSEDPMWLQHLQRINQGFEVCLP
jgi:hypothetical protein